MDMNVERDYFCVNLISLSEDNGKGEIVLSKQNQHYDFILQLKGEIGEMELTVKDGNGACVSKCMVSRETECCQVGSQSFVITSGCVSILLHFRTHTEFQAFLKLLKRRNESKKETSVFDQRTDDSSALQYFQFYGCLSQQQNMLQDYLRTATYQKAILVNEADFKDKTVLDVGCGLGLLSFFAIQAGAKKVYAVEASSVATYAQILVKSNNLSDKITVLAGKVEEVSFPEDVDIIISEPIGYMLLNERMLESYLHSRKWLKPNGKDVPHLQ
ncbi:hypothetical protein AGOR_G00244240 [Albula goreensis]|uniref:type I protein arginine methyltransferase n=1 Tax=Albula goreensis TaxID=1534307 RepID=A0A8T3CDF3_9TELE|nr:hypothetical protein AGOR_G00244240 [Albula goreensis]